MDRIGRRRSFDRRSVCKRWDVRESVGFAAEVMIDAFAGPEP